MGAEASESGMLLRESVESLARSLGADFFGVADLTGVQEVVVGQGGPMVARYPGAISIGIALPGDIVDLLPQRDQPGAAECYRSHCYDIINARLDHITSRLAGELQRHACASFPVLASQHGGDRDRLCGLFSHKLAANLAGLGWIGRSCLLVTPQVGPRARWATVLTDSPLGPAGEPMDVRCGDCHACVDICPVQAFTGEAFRPEDPREVRYDAHKCQSYLASMVDQIGFRICGLCVYACPHGSRRTASGVCSNCESLS